MKTQPSKLSTFTDSQWLLGIVCLGIVMRLAAILLYTHDPESDELAYLSMARNLLAGNGILDSLGGRAFYNMGYSFFVLAPLLEAFPDGLLAVRLGNAVLSVISIFLVYAVVREAGGNRLARLLSTLLWALYLPSGVYCVYASKENLMIPLMLGIVWCALRMRRPFPLRVAVLCGVLFGLLALTGNAGLALGAAVGLALFLSSATRRARLAGMAAICVTAALVTTPWLLRNIEVIGAPVLNTNGGFNLYLGNNPKADGMFMSIADTPRGPSWEALRKEVGELGSVNTLKSEAIGWITSHPAEFAALSVKKLGLFWMPPIHDGKGGSGGVEKLIRLVWLIQFVILTGAALFTLRQLRSQPLLILWTGVAAYSAVHMLFYVIFRYREPIIPMVCILAGIALEPMLARAGQFWRAPLVGADAPDNPVQLQDRQP